MDIIMLVVGGRDLNIIPAQALCVKLAEEETWFGNVMYVGCFAPQDETGLTSRSVWWRTRVNQIGDKCMQQTKAKGTQWITIIGKSP